MEREKARVKSMVQGAKIYLYDLSAILVCEPWSKKTTLGFLTECSINKK